MQLLGNLVPPNSKVHDPGHLPAAGERESHHAAATGRPRAACFLLVFLHAAAAAAACGEMDMDG